MGLFLAAHQVTTGKLGQRCLRTRGRTLRSYNRVTGSASLKRDTTILRIFDKSHCYLRAGLKVEVGSPRPKDGLVPQGVSEATLPPKA